MILECNEHNIFNCQLIENLYRRVIHYDFYFSFCFFMFFFSNGQAGFSAGHVKNIHVMAQIFKSGDLSNLIRSFDSISGGFLSNYFNAR